MTISKVGKNSGYTLIELLSVIFILIIIASISFPYFQGLAPAQGLKNAARDITTAIRTARNYAITFNENYTFDFYDNVNGEYRILDPDLDLEEEYSLPDGISLTAPISTFTIIFTPDGSVSGANPATITLTNVKGDSQNITVVNTTGRVKIV